MCLVPINRSVKYSGSICQCAVVAGGSAHGLALCQCEASISPEHKRCVYIQGLAVQL
jgi:hypothetical protein